MSLDRRRRKLHGQVDMGGGLLQSHLRQGFPGGTSGKEPTC